MSTPTSSPTNYNWANYVAECAANGQPGNVYAAPYGYYPGNQNFDNPQDACNQGCVDIDLDINPPLNTLGNVESPVATCYATAPAPIPSTVYTGSGYWQGGGTAPTAIPNAYGGYSADTSQQRALFNAGLAGGNASSGLTHMQIALIILLVLLVCGAGGFLVFQHAKK